MNRSRAQLNIRDRHNAQGFTLRWSVLQLGQKLEKFISYKQEYQNKGGGFENGERRKRKIVWRLKNYDDNAHY
jgi:hypothetical protein